MRTKVIILVSIIIGFILIQLYVIPEIKYRNLKNDKVIEVEETKEVETLEKESETAATPSVPIVEETTQEPEIKETKPDKEEKKVVPEYPTHKASLEIDSDGLFQINNDYVGWIDIPGTSISYPVVKGKDNNEYLHKEFKTGKYSYPGTLFMDAWEWIDAKNLIIYGHNMKSGSMFGKLKNFTNESWFNKYLYIDFYPVVGEPRSYLIFSVRRSSSDINSLNYAIDDFTVDEYVKGALKESSRGRDVNYTEDSQIITLSTCMNDNSRRFIVSAIEIKNE